MKEPLEKLEFQKWTNIFLCPLPFMYFDAIHFYKNFKVLEDGTVSLEVNGVDLDIDAKVAGEDIKCATRWILHIYET